MMTREGSILESKQAAARAQQTVQAHAKINLTLDVTGRREDGYHLVEMVMQSVALHDTVTVTVTRGETPARGIVLTCSRPDLPTDARNLAYRAAALFYEQTGIDPETCVIDIEKHIPVAAGLAGGSTDAAAVLRALNALHQTALTDDALCALGLRLGADVPYCLRGGTMLAEGIGERLSPLPPMPHAWVVLCKPPFAVSTAEIYRQIDAEELAHRPDTAGMIAALGQGDLAGVAARLSNVMEQVTARQHSEIGEICAFLRENGAAGARMSGSGPTVYGLFADERRAAAAAELLRRRFADTFLTETV